MTAAVHAPGRGRPAVEVLRHVGLPARFALLAAAVSALGVWVPSASRDEGATTTAADRSLAQLGDMVFGTVDAVHGVYYAAAHVWASLLGQDLVVLRLFSVLAIAVGAAGTVKAAQLIDGDRLGSLAGIAFLTVPMVTWTATEARSYAWVIAITTWATAALLRALRTGGRWWFVYAAAAAAGSVLFVYSALVVLCHLLAVAVLARSGRARLAGLAAGAAGLSAAAPVVHLGYRQRGQVDWIGPFTADMPRAAALQWFGESLPYATVAWILILGAIATAVARLRGRGAPSERRAASVVLAVVVPWLLLPTIALLAATAAGRPSFVPRYGAVSAAAAAILIAYAAPRVARRAWPVIGVLAILALPVFVAQRLPLANNTDWGQSAAVVQRWGQPGDAFYFAKTGAEDDPRVMLSSYREEFAGLQDLALWTPASQNASLFDSVAPAPDAIAQSGSPARVIVISDTAKSWWNSGDKAVFDAAGYHEIRTSENAKTTVVMLEKQ